MPKIDPLQLLNCLKILLSENGGIGSSKDVARVAGLMNKYSKKLVSKCIYIQILKCTNTDLLEMFMSASGWDLVYTWLVDAITKNNWILVQEVLELFLLCPVDTTRLKSNSAPKVVKNLSISGGTSVVKHLATKLVDQWLYIVKSQTPSSAQQAVKSQDSAPPPQEQEVPATNASQSGSIKILLKDGKKVLANINVEKSSGASDDGSNSPSVESEKDEVDEASTKDKKESSEKDKSSSSSSKSSKSSSSSSRHKSSSSSSKKSSSSSSSKDKSSSSSSKSSDSKDKDRHRSSSKSSSRDKDRDKDRHRSKDKSSSYSKDKDSSSSSSRSKESSRDKDSSRDKESSRDKSKSKDRESSSSSSKSSDKIEKPSERDKILEKLAKITKKTKEDDSPTSITVPSKKASISIEIKKDAEKSSAVKTYKSQFRSHGLTEEAPPPPSRKGLKKPITQPAVIPPPPVQPTSLSLKRPSPPPKEVPTEKRAKIDIITSPTSVPEKVGGVKLIAAKPKPSALVETNIFSDALSASMVPKKDVRKRKLKPKDSPAEPESPQKVVAPLKFYQDTLDEKKEEAAKAASSSPKTEDSKDDTEEDEDDIPLKKVKEDIMKKEEESKESTPPASPTTQKAEEEEIEELDEIIVKPPGPGCGPNGPPGVLSIHRRKGPKKKLTWKPEAELEQVRYFESDENERVNVTKTSFMDMKHMERCSERDAMMFGKKLNPNDNMVEQTAWVKPYEIDGEIPVLPMGSNSKEKIIQQEREKNTLKTIYFSVGMIPDSPAEPDFEHYVQSEPISIPIDDVTGNPDTVNDFTGMAWPEAKIGGGEEVMSSSMNDDNPFKPINPFNSNSFMNFQQNENNWMNHGPPMNMNGPPMNMNGPPMNMNGPPMNGPMNGPPMRPPPSFFNGPGPQQFGPPPNFAPGPGPMGPNMMNGGSPNSYGPPPNQINFNNGPPRDFGNNNRRGNGGNDRRDDRGGWRGPNGDNWRNGPPAGPGDNRGPRGNPNSNRGGPPPNWIPNANNSANNGPPRVCKQHLRGNCRNSRCNYIHPKKF